jgi:hypothetical protein
MNAESTAFRASRPAVAAPGGEGARAAAWVLGWPMRLAATPLGRRLLAAVALGAVLVSGVGYLYDSPDPARETTTIGPNGVVTARAPAPAATAPAAARRQAAAPARTTAGAGPAEVAAAWFAARQKVAQDKVRSLQQRRISATQTQVLVMAEAAGSLMPSQWVTVRKGPSGWKVP